MPPIKIRVSEHKLKIKQKSPPFRRAFLTYIIHIHISLPGYAKPLARRERPAMYLKESVSYKVILPYLTALVNQSRANVL